MRLAWLTDIHLDHAGRSQTSALWAAVRDAGADAVLLGGDIGTAPKLERHLLELRDSCGVPVYFVLGNHDCYVGSIAGARAIARRLTEQHDGLTWLGAVDVIALTERTALIGHDGWGDGGFGNAATSPVRLNDFRLIDELRLPRRSELLREPDPDWLPFFACRAAGQALADVAARHPALTSRSSGHTHGGGQCSVAGISVVTGPAEYGEPRIQDIIEVA